MALRNWFHAHRPSPPADKCMGTLRNFPGRHDRKLEFHSDAEPLVAPEVKAMSRNIACPAQDWLQLLEVGLAPDFDLKGQFVPTSCPTFFQFTWPNGLRTHTSASSRVCSGCSKRSLPKPTAIARSLLELLEKFLRVLWLDSSLHRTTCASRKHLEHSKQRLVSDFAIHPAGAAKQTGGALWPRVPWSWGEAQTAHHVPN